MMKQQKRQSIGSQPQLAALAAAARQEIVDVLADMGTVSVAELAAALGRPADALYFHLRALSKVGLVDKVGYRACPGGKEALFRTVARELRLHYDPRQSTNCKAVSEIVSSMLRLGIRDFKGAFRPGNVTVFGRYRDLWASRKVGRLSEKQLAQLNRQLEALVKGLSAARGRGRQYALTFILTPLDHRNRVIASERPDRRKRP